MSAAIMAPTPALPPLRKASVWEKMFGSIKLNHKKTDSDYEYEVCPTDNSMDQKRSVSSASGTGRDTPKIHVHRRTASVATKSSAAAVSVKTMKSTASRAGSFSSTMSRRSTKKWWRSSNPQEDDLPPVPAIDTRFASMFGSHNPDADTLSPSTASPPQKMTYVPRNAAGSFLRTTTPAKKSTQEALNEVSQQLSPAESGSLQSKFKPVPIKTIELRKDSHVQPEQHGMYSMAGVCEITKSEITEVDEAVSPTSHERAPLPIDAITKRTDSAKGSPELPMIKPESEREPSVRMLST